MPRQEALFERVPIVPKEGVWQLSEGPGIRCAVRDVH
jgi:hypothetical protein